MKWNRQTSVKVVVSLATFAFSGWLAFIGCYVNLVRIQSTIFSVSAIAFFLMVLGFIAAVSCFALFSFPRSAGFITSSALVLIAGLGIYNMIERYSSEFLFFVARTVGLPLALATGVLALFVFSSERDSLRNAED